MSKLLVMHWVGMIAYCTLQKPGHEAKYALLTAIGNCIDDNRQLHVCHEGSAHKERIRPFITLVRTNKSQVSDMHRTEAVRRMSRSKASSPK